MDTYGILVVVLSVSLVGVLITLFIALVYIVRILQHVHRIAAQAEKVADKVESVSEFFKQGAGLSSISRIIGALAEAAVHRGSSKRK